MPEPPKQLTLLLEPSILVGLEKHGDVAGLLEVAIDAVDLQIRLDSSEVLSGKPLEKRHLVGKASEPIRNPMRERCDAEPTIAPGSAGSNRVGLEAHHLPPGVL